MQNSIARGMAIAFFLFAGAVRADDSAEFTDAIGYFEGAKLILKDEVTQYDVVIHWENTVEVEDILAPNRIVDWRVRCDRDQQFYCFAYADKTLSTEEAAKGNLDNWHANYGVVIIDGSETSSYVPNVRVSRRRYPDFETALVSARVPKLSRLCLSDFPRSLTKAKATDEKILRVLGRAKEIDITSVSNASESRVNVKAVLKDDIMVETHLWQFAEDDMAPVLYQIYQRHLVGKNAKRNRILSLSAQWGAADVHRNVPLSVSGSTMIRIGAKPRSGEKKRYLFGSSNLDAKFTWLPFGESSKNKEMRREPLTVRDVEELIATE
ncbi:MAG: hypothetical protein MI861_07765 [Pirellulales bacterium]|nr:hypothetical protein [Pirellulales bacterium]